MPPQGAELKSQVKAERHDPCMSPAKLPMAHGINVNVVLQRPQIARHGQTAMPGRDKTFAPVSLAPATSRSS